MATPTRTQPRLPLVLSTTLLLVVMMAGASDPVQAAPAATLADGRALLHFPSVRPGYSNSILSLDFRTDRPDGLLFYVRSSTHIDFQALELFHGQLYWSGQVGSGRLTVSLPVTEVRDLDDGEWHSVVAQRRAPSSTGPAQLLLSIDGAPAEPVLEDFPASNARNLDVDAGVFVGGAPAAVWASPSAAQDLIVEHNFTGCVRNVVLDGRDLLDQAAANAIPLDAAHADLSGCVTRPASLTCDSSGGASSPCHPAALPGSACEEGLLGLRCVCGADLTDSAGGCSRNTTVAYFERTGAVDFALPVAIHETQTQLELSFRTTMPDGPLFTLTGRRSGPSDHLAVFFAGGTLMAEFNLGGGAGSLTVPMTGFGPDPSLLDDNQWHRFVLRRVNQQAVVLVDGALLGTISSPGAFVSLDSWIGFHVGNIDPLLRTPASGFFGLLRDVRFDHIEVLQLGLDDASMHTVVR